MSTQRPLHRFVQANLTVAAAAFGLIGGLTIALARHAPSERDLPLILTSPQIQVDARYLKATSSRAYGTSSPNTRCADAGSGSASIRSRKS